MTITSKQAEKLEVKNNTQISPCLEACCLRISANVSYERAEEDIEYLTGIHVSKSTQQRLVHRSEFVLPESIEPVSELSVDGGNIRIRTELGEPCKWKGYKATCLHDTASVAASFAQNEILVNWVNAQPLAPILTCLGDGHDGVWNIVAEFGETTARREVLDWFHLIENLHKVGGSLQRLNQAENLLWQGKVDDTIALFTDCNLKPAENFCNYLNKHRHRIINYSYYQAEGICSIGSGAIESTIKQIDRRIKISGAQWKEDNVPQVLAHRCAYLNGTISP